MSDLKQKLEHFFLEGWTSYVSIAAGMLILLALIGTVTVYSIRGRARRMTTAHVMQPREIKACAKVDTVEKLEFVNGQRAEIVKLANQHHENAISYFGYFYATYLVMTIFGLIAAICLAVITKSGISQSSPHVLAVFLISTAIVVLYQGSFDTLKQKANIDLNANASVKYAVLADQIDTYCSTGKISMKDPNDVLLAALPKPEPTQSPGGSAANTSQQQPASTVQILPFFVEPDGDQFINFVAWQMDHLRSFAITIDESKVGSIDSKRFMF
jgi:hypothetical protein